MTKGYQWTSWIDTDDPDGTGDWESLASFQEQKSCSNPVGIQAYPLGLNAATSKVGDYLIL